MSPQRSNNKFHNLGSPPNAALIWPKYCRYGVKHYIINQSFLKMLDLKKMVKRYQRNKKCSTVNVESNRAGNSKTKHGIK